MISPDLPLLIPGVGAQGGDLEQSVKLGNQSSCALVNISRGISFAKLIPLEILTKAQDDWFPNLTLCSKSPPWAPTPGINKGKSGDIILIVLSSSTAVAPTTNPTLFLTF